MDEQRLGLISKEGKVDTHDLSISTDQKQLLFSGVATLLLRTLMTSWLAGEMEL